MQQNLKKNARIAVAMSGGVDSSVCAAVLQEAGYDIFGVTMTLWSCHSRPGKATKTCCSTADVADARAVCDKLGIEHVVADFREEFRAKVIDQFVDEYSKARTPIPCVGCNQYFKFDRLWEVVRDEYGADYIATGHYAQITRDEAGKAQAFLRGVDHKKDQSYYLFVMTDEQVEHSLFPLGHMTKPEVRAKAEQLGLVTADKPESQEICFVPDNDYAGFIEDFYPEKAGQRGNFLDQRGQVLGQHEGTHAFTIGQRRGLGLSTGKKQYVTKIDAASRTVMLGDAQDLLEDHLIAHGVNWIHGQPAVGESIRAQVKIRSNHAPVACLVHVTESGSIAVDFDEPVASIAPGQAVVIYDGERVRGGGWIERGMRRS